MDRDAIKLTPLTEWLTANATLEGAKQVSYHSVATVATDVFQIN
jgi:hypothetical protein